MLRRSAIFLAKVILLLNVSTSAENISVSYKGTECRCLSYYSPPNYDCLLEELENNRTLPALCLHLLQAMDSGHKFRIIKSDRLDCGTQGFYQYRRMGFIGRFGRKIYLQKNICKSRFEKPSTFQIWTPRKEFFQVVARNLELLDLGDITCKLHAAGLLSDIRCKDWKVSKIYWKKLFSITDSHSYDPEHVVDETFLLKNGLISSTEAITYYNSFLRIGFLSPDPKVDQLSPGSFVINKPEMSHTYIGHLLRFSCQWGDNSSYLGSTTSCIKDRYDSEVCKPSAEEKMERKFSSREWSLTLRLDFQRVFKNSIVIQLNWKLRDEQMRRKKFETVCRVFDAQDHTYQPGACVSCWKKQRNCSECWDTASFDGHLSPSFHFRSLNYSHYYALVQRKGNQTIILRTNHQNITFKNKPFHTNPRNHRSHFYNIYQYDYIFGSYSAYMPEGRKAQKRSNTRHAAQEHYLSSSVFLPGQQKIPTDLSPQQVHSLSIICRVRSVFTDNSVSEFSNPVWTTFSKNIFSTTVLVFKPYRVEPLKIIKSGDRWKVIDREDLFPTYIKHLDSRIFSNKLFDNEYMFSTVCMENNNRSCSSSITKHRLNYADEKSRAMKPSDMYADSKPLDRKCASLHRFLIWSEKGERKEIKLFQVCLENESGKPLSSKKTLLNGERLCGCSSHKSITSPSFDVVYRNMDNPQSVEVAVVCGDVICLYDLNIHQSSKLPFNLANRTVASMVMDQNFVIFVREDRYSTSVVRKVVRIVPITYNGSVRSLPHGYYSDGHNIKMLQIQAIHPPVHLPIPPKHCMDPFINPDHTTVKMSDNSTISIEVTVSWDNAPECDLFLRPSVAVSIVYAKIPSYMILREYPGMRCASIQGLECKKLPTSIFRGPSSFTSAITEVLRDKYYLVDISVWGAFDKQTYDIWYAGSPMPEGQTLGKVISTEYTETPDYVWIIVAAAVTILVVLLVTGMFYWSYMQKMYMYKHLNRISAKDIKKEEKIGEGNFGEVWRAILGKQTIVLKMLKESATDREEKEFREEALLLSKFNSDYIVRAVGICLQSRPIMLGLEFVNGGSLNTYLKRDDVRSKLHADDMFQIAEQALRGCVYLEQEGYIHRDIAARNCLIATASDANLKPKCVKLSDFGLAKDTGAESIYKSRDPDADTLPIAWTAPEAFRGKFSTKSDVWAFGVLIWEIFTWAAIPYGECSDTSKWHICPISTLSHEEIEFKVCAERKNLLNFPDPCTAVLCSALKNVISACLQFAADERPSFLQLQKFLSAAKSEVLKMDVQMCFKKSANPPGRSQGSSVDPPIQATRMGDKKRFVHDAYRDTEEDHHKENPFNKDDDFSGEIGNEEAVELLPHMKQKQRFVRDAYRDATEEDHQKEKSFNKDGDFSGEMGNEDSVEFLPRMKQVYV